MMALEDISPLTRWLFAAGFVGLLSLAVYMIAERMNR